MLVLIAQIVATMEMTVTALPIVPTKEEMKKLATSTVII